MKLFSMLALIFVAQAASANWDYNPCEVTFGRTIIQYTQQDRNGNVVEVPNMGQATFISDFRTVLAKGGVIVDFAEKSNGKPFVKSAIIVNADVKQGFFSSFYMTAYSVGIEGGPTKADSVDVRTVDNIVVKNGQKIIDFVIQYAKSRGCNVNAKAARI